MKYALLVGNSDGIGLATTHSLLHDGWTVIGVSRSASSIQHDRYSHIQLDVASIHYRDTLRTELAGRPPLDVAIYCVGIGDRIDLDHLDRDVDVFEVNLVGAVSTAAVIVPSMLRARAGHFIALSSLADVLISPENPSYNASKAAMSSYFDGLGLALRSKGVAVSYIRFGFVDTKMAKSDVKPFMVSREVAAGVVMKTIRTRRLRVSFPWRMAWLIAILVRFQKLRQIFGK